MRVTVSVTRPATLIRQRRIVSNWASRQPFDKLRRGPRRDAAQGQHQPVGGGMDQEAELVGGGLGARGAAGSEMQLVRLDQVFGLSACTIDLLVERLGQAWQIGDDEAAIGTLRAGLDASDEAAFEFPAFGGVAEVVIAANLVTLAGEAAHSCNDLQSSAAGIAIIGVACPR